MDILIKYSTCRASKYSPSPPIKGLCGVPFGRCFFSLYKESLPADLGAGQHDGTKRHGFYFRILSWRIIPSLKLTAIAPENWCLEDEFPFGAKGLFSGAMSGLGSVCFSRSSIVNVHSRALFHGGWSLGPIPKIPHRGEEF